jgi:hypothetical protein
VGVNDEATSSSCPSNRQNFCRDWDTTQEFSGKHLRQSSTHGCINTDLTSKDPHNNYGSFSKYVVNGLFTYKKPDIGILMLANLTVDFAVFKKESI